MCAHKRAKLDRLAGQEVEKGSRGRGGGGGGEGGGGEGGGGGGWSIPRCGKSGCRKRDAKPTGLAALSLSLSLSLSLCVCVRTRCRLSHRRFVFFCLVPRVTPARILDSASNRARRTGQTQINRFARNDHD